jgi:Spy/CpxP family protein refolding chaperone
MKYTIKTALMLSALMLSTALTFAQQRPTPDPLMGLKRALNEAGAADLTEQQATQITTLVKAFHEAQTPPSRDAMQDAQQAYDAAIAAGNAAAANTAATTIANLMSTQQAARLQAGAKFKIDVLAVLKANEAQYAALLQRFGTKGVTHLPDSLLGGPGGGRPGPGGPGGPGFGGPGGGPGGGFGPAGRPGGPGFKQ